MTVYQFGNSDLAVRCENDPTHHQPIYVGEAQPGTEENTESWRIKKITYDSSDAVIDVKWAEGSKDFNKKWSERATYTYK